MTGRAGVRNYLAGASAMTAGGADGEKTLRAGNLSSTLAMGACSRTGAGFESGGFAGWAGLVPLDFDLCFLAESGFHKGDLQVISEIGALSGPGTSTTARAEAEEVAEIGKNVFETGKTAEVGAL